MQAQFMAQISHHKIKYTSFFKYMQKSALLKICGQVGCVKDPVVETSVPPLQKNIILQTITRKALMQSIKGRPSKKCSRCR
jgi:hypothetical protein